METGKAKFDSYKLKPGPIPKPVGHYHIGPVEQWKYENDGWAYFVGYGYRVSVKVGPKKYRITMYSEKRGEEQVLEKVRKYIQGVRLDLGFSVHTANEDLPDMLPLLVF